MKTIALFADVSNLYFCVNKKFTGRKLNYEKYLKITSNGDKLYRAFAYGTVINEDTIRFIDCLKHLGYEPKFGDPKIHNKADGTKEYWKLNWNVGIAMDIVRLIDKVDSIIIGSNSTELLPLIDWIQEKGVRCVIIACGIPFISRKTANKWIEIDQSYLEELKNEVTKTAE